MINIILDRMRTVLWALLGAGTPAGYRMMCEVAFKDPASGEPDGYVQQFEIPGGDPARATETAKAAAAAAAGIDCDVEVDDIMPLWDAVDGPVELGGRVYFGGDVSDSSDD